MLQKHAAVPASTRLGNTKFLNVALGTTVESEHSQAR